MMVLILGVTGSGKGRLAFELAAKLGAEIISIDSMKVYRRMNIGTAKPPVQARREVRYHLIDLLEPSESFSVGAFLNLALEAIEQTKTRKKPIVAVGGTALYIKVLLYGLFDGPGTDEEIRDELRARQGTEGLAVLHHELARVDPDAAQRINPNDAKRIIRAMEVYHLTGKPISSLQRQFNAASPMYDWTIIGLRRDKTDSSSRINRRVKTMIEAGLVDEVRALLAENRPLSMQARCAIGYAEIIDHLAGKMSLDQAVELIKKNTRHLAKSQRTWFRTFKSVNWLDITPDEPLDRILARTEQLLNSQL